MLATYLYNFAKLPKMQPKAFLTKISHNFHRGKN
jgi:hypothetical protein